MHTYIHKVHYYETDKMGVVHHSNYIRWMEEARLSLLETIGYSYAQMERDGVVSPVISMECRYKHPATFNDEVEIAVGVEEFRGVRLVVGYTMTDKATGKLVLTGRSMHCFTDMKGKPLILKKQFPGLDRALRSLAPDRDAVGGGVLL